ncbi:MAG: efflux RND transporter periplasmic adaptor subunit [Gammaproteobacteria bacterium HGW-Gammaproteobacteria-2]|jgi:multidrug efflux system membrane fusion protein|nr:MAG: efflux RND transporter periplasmic adaptor subunit [Gammaproteobacteria bacterium HGW-Gammaproteobacteria-2]
MSNAVTRYVLNGTLLLLLTACSGVAQEVEQVRPALVVQPQTGEGAIVAYAGEVRARYEPALGFRIGGKIIARAVDVGDRVAAGALLAELDPDDVRLQAQAAQAQWRAAQADLELARAERERAAALIERKLVSASVYDSRDAAWRAAQAKARQAKAQWDVASNQAGYSKLYAPEAGVIAARHAEAGQVVAAGQAVFTLAVDGEREIAIDIPEQRIAQFKMGQKVTVALWAQSGSRFPGHIRELSPAADPQTRTYAARVTLDAGTALAELGQTARVYTAGTDAARQLMLPLSAVSAEDGVAFAWVVDPATARLQRRPLVLGAYQEDRVPVISGLRGEEWVVAGGVHLLREGQRVAPVDRDNRAVILVQTP